MNRSDLIKRLAARKNISYVVAKKIFQEIFESIADALVAGSRVEIRGFGSFEDREYEEYEGRNPKTGEVLSVKSKKVPFFKVGKELKERINDI